MFKQIASLFAAPEPERPYAIYLKGIEVARSVSKKDAEEWILKTFNEIDIKHVEDHGFGTTCNTSKSFRRKQFREQYEIVKICKRCGFHERYCGQC